MRMGAGCWLVVGLLLGCGVTPSEVVGVYEGQGSSSSGGSGDSPSSGGGGSANTGPVAEGSAGSDTGMPPATSTAGDTTHAVDPTVTDPGTTTVDLPDTTGPMSTGDDMQGSSASDDPPPTQPPCEDVFGDASGYVLCMEDAMSCAFNVNLFGLDCTGICNMFDGAACLDAIDNPNAAGQECMVQPNDLDCSSSGKSTLICVCARPA